MEQILNTALLYITNFLSVNAVMFEHRQDFSLPDPYASQRENRLIRQYLMKAPDNSFLLVQDSSRFHFCFIFLGQHILLIGPYCAETLRPSAIPSHLSGTKQERSEYVRYYNSLPVISEETIKLAVHTLFVSLYGDCTNILENRINMRQYRKEDVIIPEEIFSVSEKKADISENDFTIFFIEQVRAGNFQKAMSIYRKIMLGRGSSFILLHTIEGLSTLRTQLRIALAQAGVPPSSYAPLFQNFKKAGRVVTNIEEAKRLAEHLINQSCKLVLKTKSSKYSPCIASSVDYIHQNLSEPLDISAIARAAALSPNSLSSKFHKETGLTPTSYIAKERMEMAAHLLVYTNMSMQNICTQIGILDSNYFSRCFKKHYGLSPTDYRKQKIQQDSF